MKVIGPGRVGVNYVSGELFSDQLRQGLNYRECASQGSLPKSEAGEQLSLQRAFIHSQLLSRPWVDL